MENAGDAKLGKFSGAEYIVFANIARTSVAREDDVVTASAVSGEVRFATDRRSAE